MCPSSAVISGTVIVEGVPFVWTVADGLTQQLAVNHPIFGTETRRLTKSPDSQAREIGREMLQRQGRWPTD
jgi:hypothetical protein